MRCIIVSHTHWDREWYKTFQAFRARLVDTVDCVLDLVAADPGYAFLLDGQTIVIEDYLAVRPEREPELRSAVEAGRVAVGPWYVQPDSLIPSGETHVRNLLEGRRIAQAMGGGSQVAYTPDSFGHPAQFPQLFRGFGLGPFVYWRGNGDEIADLPVDYRWQSPDGSEVIACHLARGYFAAWGLGDDVEAAADRLQKLANDLAPLGRRETVLLMNGIDHMLPDTTTAAVAEALSSRTGWRVERSLLDAYVSDLGPTHGEGLNPALPVHSGELVGGRVANLLPGVWSTHPRLKLANRRCEAALQGWVEPFSALGALLGAPNEAPSLRLAWRELLPNQAHDSICGCSQDRVHEQMAIRFDSVLELADETTTRLLERLAGRGVDRQAHVAGEDGAIELAVWNPSPHPRSDVVRLPLEGFPAFSSRGVHPLLQQNLDAAGFEVDGRPARLEVYEGTRRPGLMPGRPQHDIEFVAEDVPGFGWKRVVLRRAEAVHETVDAGREIETETIRAGASRDGTLWVEIGGRRYENLFGVEDVGDRGDTYDFDEAPGPEPQVIGTRVRRRVHPSGIQHLEIRRVLLVSRGLTEDRSRRRDDRCELELEIIARVAPGVPRVDVHVRLENTAKDHRLRLLFPSGAPASQFHAATTFDEALRSSGPRDGSSWIHPAPATFPQQGLVSLNGLAIAAPGLLEAEVTPDGCLALTLVRATGWLSRPDLKTRPGEAGPSLPTPGAQSPGRIEAAVSLMAAEGSAPHRLARARDAELGLRVVMAGDAPLAEPHAPLLAISPPELQLSAWKPAESGEGSVLRLLNPTNTPKTARVSLAPALAAGIERIEVVSLDENPTGKPVVMQNGEFQLLIPGRRLCSVWLVPKPR